MVELWQIDYSYKAVKTNVAHEAQWMKIAQMLLTNPVQYGAMPDLGRYSQPDGPIPNWSELLPLGKIAEARAAQEQAAEMLVTDIQYVADHMVEAGADGIDFDTTGAAGDCDFQAALIACRKLREKYPHLGIEIGMAGEFVIGMHGQAEFDGKRLAGLWPKQQLELVQSAGASIFGPCVNINTGKSTAWNIARAITMIKPLRRSPRSPFTSTSAWASAGCPRACTRRPTPPAAPPSRSSRFCGSTDTRQARATPWAWRGRTRRRLAWADCGRPETWSLACR